MTTNFPTSLDSLPSPGPATNEDDSGFEHDIVHTNANDAIEALEAKVGVNGSAVSTSLDRQMEIHAHTGSADDGGQVAAADVSFSPTGSISSNTVQAAVAEVASEAGTGLSDHLADTTDAHDASAVSILDSGGFYTGAEVETALIEVFKRTRINFTLVAGQDETSDATIPVTGMAAGDSILSVMVFTTASAIASLAAHAGTFTAGSAEFTVGTPANNSGNQYLIIWLDLT